MDHFTQGYVECATWAEDLDAHNLAPETIATMTKDCERFQRHHAQLLERYVEHRTMGHAGHDFWLTRNRHGAGFWDRGLPDDLGKLLTDAAHAFGGVDLYLGDDGKIYQS